MSSLSVKLSFPTRVQPEVMPQPGMAGVYTNQMHYFKKHLLDELSKKKFATDFMNPVDTEELQIPHYYSVIKKPMDVGTITKRVENNYYRDVEEAIADFRLLIRNCYLFNGVETLVYRKGVQLEKFFLRAIKNIPKGPPVPCNKDPMSTCKLKANPMAGALEQECRNQLRRLQTYTNQADATARNFFGPKWNSFSAKLDKQFFKSLEEFRSHVDGMFKKYHDQARMIYEKVYDQPGGFEGNGSTSTPAPTSDRATPASSICLSVAEVSDLLLAVELTQNSLNQCLKHPQKSKTLAETFSATMAQFKVKLEAMKSAIAVQNSSNNEANPSIVEEKQVPAGLYLPTEGLDFLVDTPDAGLSEDDPKLDPIDQEERRSIQTQFSTLPARAMREICGIVHANEVLGRDSAGGFTFDLNTFELANVQIMKAAVARALKLNSKVNLRDMQPEEKEGLRCSLQSQLSDLTERLNQSRRKNAAPLASDRNNNNAKNNANQKRGRKRARSLEPQMLARTPAAEESESWAFSPPSPPSPVQTAAKTGHKSKKPKKGDQWMPEYPKRQIHFNPESRIKGHELYETPFKVPKTPGGWFPGGQIPLCKKTGNAIKFTKHRSRSRGPSPVGASPVNQEPADTPPFESPEQGKWVKTLRASSSDEEVHADKDYESPCSSSRPKGKKSKKAPKKKCRLALTPGNVLNNDLSLSSSSSDGGSDED